MSRLNSNESSGVHTPVRHSNRRRKHLETRMQNLDKSDDYEEDHHDDELHNESDKPSFVSSPSEPEPEVRLIVSQAS